MTTTVTAEDNAPKVLISQSGRKGDPGTNGTNGDGFNQVRKSLIDNPLCHLFKTNKLVDTSAPTGTDSDITFTRASTATYVDRYGIVKTAAVNTIREEKDGFLIEETGTNIIVYSEQFDNGAWPKSNINVTANATTAPDGTTSADLLTGVANSALTFQQKNISNSTKYTFSLFVKNSTLTADSRLNVNNGSINFNVFFNLVSGTITSVTAGFEGSIKTLDNGWFRVTATFLSHPSTSLATFYIVTSDQQAGSFYAWGAQVEQSTSATSYIPTVATAVTRLADRALLPVLNNVVTKEFSIFGIISNTSSSTTGNKFIFRMPVTAGFFALFFNVASNQYYFRYDDNSAGVQPTVISTGNIKYFVVTVDESNVTININGTESLTSKLSDPSLLLANNFPIFASTVSVGAQFNGNIKDFRIYDFALNANEVEYLSQ